MVPRTHRRWWVALPLIGVLALIGAGTAFADPGDPNGKAVGHSEHAGATAAKGPVDDPDSDHPSGKSRDPEPGGSAPQGSSESEPDDDGHGPDRLDAGLDKPGGGGGEDDDWDGNNGCGNDTDLNDDNEGWCGKPAEAAAVSQVGGEQEERAAREERAAERAAERAPSEVLGVTLERAAEVAGAGLSRTGSDVLPIAAAGLAMLLGGSGLVIAKRRRR